MSEKIKRFIIKQKKSIKIMEKELNSDGPEMDEKDISFDEGYINGASHILKILTNLNNENKKKRQKPRNKRLDNKKNKKRSK